MSLAKGIQLQIGDGGSPTEVFSAINARTEFNPPDYDWGNEDLTNHDSEDPVTQKGPTLKTIMGFPMTIRPFNDADPNHVLLVELNESGAPRNFKIIHAHSSLGKFPIRCFVQNLKPLSEIDRSLGASFLLNPTGNITDSPPTLASVAVVDAQAGAYVTGEKMILEATFDEVVKVMGTPRIAVVLATGTVYATYVSGTGTNKLRFEKTFGGGDQADATEVSITSPLDLNGGTIKDIIAQAPGALTFTPPDTSAFTVN